MKCKAQKVWPQYQLTFLCNIGTLTFGLHTGWLAPLHLRFMSEDSPLGYHLATEEISWIGSIPAISFFLGTLLYGYFLQKIGRRRSALLAVLPNVACFLILIFSCNVYMIYAARFIAGFASAGSLLVTPVYVNESTSDEVRGFLCGLSSFSVNIGLVISATAGGYFPYWLFNSLCLGFSIVFVCFYFWLPETPVYSVMKGRTKDARDTLKKLRRWKEAEIEFEILRLENELGKRAERKGLRELFRDPGFIRGLFLAVGVMTVHQLSGYSPIMSYSAQVFHDAGTGLEPAPASIAMTLMLLSGSVLGAYLMDKTGRRTLLVTSLTIMAVNLFVLSGFVYLKNPLPGFGWVPAATLFIYMGTFASGIGSVSFVLVTELFQPEVRGISGAICGTWASIIGFITVKFFPFVVESASLAPVLALFASCCAAGAVFSMLFLVETLGKSSGEIAGLLAGPARPTKA